MKLNNTKRKLTSITITILILCSFSLFLDNILVEGAIGEKLSTLEGSIPNAPTHPYPPHGSNGVSTDTILSVYVTSPDDNSMNYYARLHGNTLSYESGPKEATINYIAYGTPLPL